MPYIEKYKRALYEGYPRAAADEGELNYRMAREIDKYLQAKGLRYKNLNAVIGVLQCLSLEVYRRIGAPYENQKIDENGDVFSESYDSEDQV